MTTTEAGDRSPDPEPSSRPPPATAADAGLFAGWLDHVSLTLTVAHSKAELVSALTAQQMHNPLDDLARTYVHELTHTGQALGSTVGYYTWMLRSVQHDYVIRMLKWLVGDAGLPIRTPLIRYLPAVQGEGQDAKLAGLMHGWQLAEAMIAEIAGSPEGYLHSAVQMPVEATS
jgi:hypothetical protein